MEKKKILEKDITRAIKDYLKLELGVYHWKVFQSLGSKKGLTDIEGVFPVSIKTLQRLGFKRVGLFFGCEVKTPKGKLTDHQQEHLEKIRSAGGLAIVARSTDDIKHLKKIVDR